MHLHARRWRSQCKPQPIFTTSCFSLESLLRMRMRKPRAQAVEPAPAEAPDAGGSGCAHTCPFSTGEVAAPALPVLLQSPAAPKAVQMGRGQPVSWREAAAGSSGSSDMLTGRMDLARKHKQTPSPPSPACIQCTSLQRLHLVRPFHRCTYIHTPMHTGIHTHVLTYFMYMDISRNIYPSIHPSIGWMDGWMCGCGCTCVCLRSYCI